MFGEVAHIQLLLESISRMKRTVCFPRAALDDPAHQCQAQRMRSAPKSPCGADTYLEISRTRIPPSDEGHASPIVLSENAG